MIEYDEIIEDSPLLVNHVITLMKTHDFYINKHIKSETEILQWVQTNQTLQRHV